jgi:hypothetical protein
VARKLSWNEMIQDLYKPESFIKIDAPDAFSDPFSKLKLKKNFSFSKPAKEIMLCSTAAAESLAEGHYWCLTPASTCPYQDPGVLVAESRRRGSLASSFQFWGNDSELHTKTQDKNRLENRAR